MDNVQTNAVLQDPPEIIGHCLALLQEMYDPVQGVFSYSTTLSNGVYVNDFDHKLHIRYTINTLLGLQKASQFYRLDWDVSKAVILFLDKQLNNVTNRGDQGLLLYTLARMGHADLPNLLKRYSIENDLESGKLKKLTAQEASWLLLGLTACAKGGLASAKTQAKDLFKTMHANFVNLDSLFIRHNLSSLRSDFVSFGAMVYYLKSWYEYGEVFDDNEVRETVKAAIETLMDRQLPDGGWPWFYDVNTSRVRDVYEVYSVHQDAMAMLFLFPGKALGIQGIDEAVQLSVDWLYKNNELAVDMINQTPFLIYRSIRRRQPYPRAQRLARALLGRGSGKDASPLGAPGKLEVNKECRSYHIGWLIYAWSGQENVDKIFQPTKGA